jgi:TetR/AcrR family transcriptional repressor of uid operon
MASKRRREHPDVRRSQILAAAKTSFRVHGLRATPIDAIAAEADVSVGLLYRFFKSKAEIVEAIILEDVEQQLAQVALALEDHSADPAELRQLITDRLAGSSADPERLALMFEIAAEICRNPTLRAFVRKKRAELRDELVARFATRGLDRHQADRLIEQLDRTSSFATGLAVHAILYSVSLESLPADLAKLAEVVDHSDR